MTAFYDNTNTTTDGTEERTFEALTIKRHSKEEPQSISDDKLWASIHNCVANPTKSRGTHLCVDKARSRWNGTQARFDARVLASFRGKPNTIAL